MRTDMRRTAIVSHDGDLHALMVCDQLRRSGGECSVIASDALTGTDGMTWYLDAEDGAAVMRNVDGHEVEVRDLDLVWWRRMPRGFSPDNWGQVPGAVEIFAARNVRNAILGAFLNDFAGIWLDHPEAMQRADNKLTQLRAASAAGLRVPRTLVSQNPERIREFAASLGGQMIVKTVSGVLGIPSLTGKVTSEHLEDDGPLRACPAIYQELIPGRRHLRVHCFGRDVHAVLLESDLLDWRHPMDAEVAPYTLAPALQQTLLNLLRQLGLQMGIFDLKLTGEDEPVWLELNPQGQFLFIEALGGGNLVDPFVSFVQEMIERHKALQSAI